jgi:hypothetical protein
MFSFPWCRVPGVCATHCEQQAAHVWAGSWQVLDCNSNIIVNQGIAGRWGQVDANELAAYLHCKACQGSSQYAVTLTRASRTPPKCNSKLNSTQLNIQAQHVRSLGRIPDKHWNIATKIVSRPGTESIKVMFHRGKGQQQFATHDCDRLVESSAIDLL